MFDIEDKSHRDQVWQIYSDDDYKGQTVGFAGVTETKVILDLYNNPARNPVDGEQGNKSIDDVLVTEVSAVIVPAEYAGLTEYDKAWVDAMIGQPPEVALRPFKSKFLIIFNNTQTLTNAQDLLNTDVSIMEGTFSVGDVLTQRDWAIISNENRAAQATRGKR